MQDIFPATAERLERWKAQPDVLGILLVGSKSHNHADTFSDDDLEILLTEEALARLTPLECSELFFTEEESGQPPRLIYDAQYITLTALQKKRTSTHDLDHWPYQRGRILFDRNGDVRPIVEELGQMDPEFRHTRLLHATIDTSVGINRAKKTLARGQTASGHLLVAQAARALARVLFTLEWRWTSLDHWLESELRTLTDPTGSVPLVVEALLTNSPLPVEQALKQLEDPLAEAGVARPTGRKQLFMELMHPDRSVERAIHRFS